MGTGIVCSTEVLTQPVPTQQQTSLMDTGRGHGEIVNSLGNTPIILILWDRSKYTTSRLTLCSTRQWGQLNFVFSEDLLRIPFKQLIQNV